MFNELLILRRCKYIGFIFEKAVSRKNFHKKMISACNLSFYSVPPTFTKQAYFVILILLDGKHPKLFEYKDFQSELLLISGKLYIVDESEEF